MILMSPTYASWPDLFGFLLCAQRLNDADGWTDIPTYPHPEQEHLLAHHLLLIDKNEGHKHQEVLNLSMAKLTTT
ncbi:hypothetical protein HJC23_009813 [Cyclotella cryptica]|uniref:Uncharacterized protein n=1 Tax=Cyclotella cryptica TaxID=29204 RepID=A0ABD3PJ23_9STRA